VKINQKSLMLELSKEDVLYGTGIVQPCQCLPENVDWGHTFDLAARDFW
jgi:hypothetical protein